MTGEFFHVAQHGQPAGQGRRGTPVDPSRVRIIGHSHNHTPPFWRRMWLRLRGKWPVRYVVTGAVLPGFALEYNRGPSQWDHGHIPVPRNMSLTFKLDPVYLSAAGHLGLEADPMIVFKDYCEQDVELERRIHIIRTQPAARIQPNGSIMYDSWHWTGRTK